MAALLGFDPLQLVSEVAVICAVAVAGALAWKYRDRILMAVTGDDRIHASSLDCVWFACFRCCGTCTGDWTRCLTRWPCCPTRARGANLVKVCGQCCGITTYTVELKNIVVGDLPYDKRGDFFLVVECAANPPMMSSLAEEKLPKVVHFPEIITLRIRWSPLEKSVRIAVKELNMLGSDELCHCFISAMSILDWSEDPNEKMKRFEMKQLKQGMERETPAWILLEFDQPHEARDLDNFHGQINTVRTATRDGHYTDTSVGMFKRDYLLLDAEGQPMEEPLEEDVQEMQNLRACRDCFVSCCTLWTCMLIALFSITRAYAWSCYRRYQWITMAYMSKAHFPISAADIKHLVEKCDSEVGGTAVASGIPCNPNATNIMEICIPKGLGGSYPEKQPLPRAFAWTARDFGIPCLTGVCGVHEHLPAYDAPVIGGCILLALLGCCCKMRIDNALYRKKRDRLHEKVQHTRRVQEHMASQSRSLGVFGSLF